MQQGRAAMSLQSMGRNRIYNDPQKSRNSPARSRPVAVPISTTLAGSYDVAPAKVEFWGMVDPEELQAQGPRLELHQGDELTKEATLKAALNGNGPVRASTYDDAGFAQQRALCRAEELKVLKVARVPLPAFDEAARAGDIFKEEAEAAVLGMKTPEEAMASLVKRVKPLLPA